jgi:hypothetical protein
MVASLIRQLAFNDILESFDEARRDIFDIILKEVGSIICFKSQLKTSPPLTMYELIKDFPESSYSTAKEVVYRLVERHFLIRTVECELETFRTNPNRAGDIRRLLYPS